MATAAPQGCIILPYLNNPEMTTDALNDASAQLDGEVLVVSVNNGGPDSLNTAIPGSGTPTPYRMPCAFSTPLPSLAALWNWGLDLAWSLGHQDAMVWNNDIRVAPGMYAALRQVVDRLDLLFLSPVNCRDLPGVSWRWEPHQVQPAGIGISALGGPDFSCFLITKACHLSYRFDERFQPAWFEDNDYHRQMWVGGDGHRIAGCPIPYWHAGASTLKAAESAGQADRLHAGFLRSQARYIEKWGGLPHQERRLTPDSTEDLDGVGTPGGYLATPPPEVPRG